MNKFRMQSSRKPSTQIGAAMVEFAFVFPILFLLVYGTVVYGYIFMLQESLTFTAQQAAASAVAVSPQQTSAAARAQMTTIAQTTAFQALSWMGSDQRSRVVGTGGEKVLVTFCNKGTAGCPADTDAINVKMIFDMTQPTPLFPVISFGGLMGLGAVPPMPDQLIAQAMVRI